MAFYECTTINWNTVKGYPEYLEKVLFNEYPVPWNDCIRVAVKSGQALETPLIVKGPTDFQNHINCYSYLLYMDKKIWT